MSHFKIPDYFVRISTSNEVVFSEDKNSCILRTKEKGCSLFTCMNDLQSRRIQHILDYVEDLNLYKSSLPASFINWRSNDGSNIFHLLCLDFRALTKFYDNFQKYTDGLEEDEKETFTQLCFMLIIYPNNNGITPFEYAMKQSSQFVDLFLQMLICVEDSQLSRFMFQDLNNFRKLMEMELASFESFLDRCFFQPKNLQIPAIRIWDEDEDELTFMSNTSLLTHRFMKKNIGANEEEILYGSDSESESESEQEDDDGKRKTETENLKGSMIKKNPQKKSKKTKEELQEQMEKKAQEAENWR